MRRRRDEPNVAALLPRDSGGASLSVIPQEVEGTRELAFIRGICRSELGVPVTGEEVVVRDEGSWLAVVRRNQDDAWRFYRFIMNPDVAPAS